MSKYTTFPEASDDHNPFQVILFRCTVLLVLNICVCSGAQFVMVPRDLTVNRCHTNPITFYDIDLVCLIHGLVNDLWHTGLNLGWPGVGDLLICLKYTTTSEMCGHTHTPFLLVLL